MGGFLSCSGFIDNVTCGSSTDDIVDFRDFCHGLAMYDFAFISLYSSSLK